MPVLILAQSACGMSFGRSTLPDHLTDEQFWTLTTTLSEPAGAFTHSDNLVSNEIEFVNVVRLLSPTGGVYIGVGPEQNFSYIARLRPEMAFIVDIRRENRDLHLMYKALFELSADRAEFVSRLFSRQRPPGVGRDSSVQDLFGAYEQVRPNDRLYATNARLIRDRLVDLHRFTLTADDLQSIDYAFRAFYSDGPDITYARSRAIDAPAPSYRVLMGAADMYGRQRSYLATEEAFAFVKGLFAANRIVPVVGDFGGPDALRRVGDYVRQHGSVVRAFYGSNVEVYLNREKMAAYCANLDWLPRTSRTWYIDSKGLELLASRVQSCRERVQRR
jgi:hypothetical protein